MLAIMSGIIKPKCWASFAVYCDRGGDILRCKCQDGYAGHVCERSVTELSGVFMMPHGVPFIQHTGVQQQCVQHMPLLDLFFFFSSLQL